MEIVVGPSTRRWKTKRGRARYETPTTESSNEGSGMDEVYRFRSCHRLLKDEGELASRMIYFAEPPKLNDGKLHRQTASTGSRPRTDAPTPHAPEPRTGPTRPISSRSGSSVPCITPPPPHDREHLDLNYSAVS